LFWSRHVEGQQWGLLHHLTTGPITEIVISIILLDLAYYGFHRFNHVVPLLWRFHRGHHSDLDIDVTTSVRFHFGEVLLTSLFKGIIVLALGVSPAGYLAFETVIFISGLYQHMNFKLPVPIERLFRPVLVTPLLHGIHHSRRSEDHNKNFGVLFSGWDRLFGTYTAGDEHQDILFGLDEYPETKDVQILPFLRIPFDSASPRIP
jgi:sterol desaturase/sphingolipid hydroxylase (fatty acid hydroxylase superfamily)